MTRITKVLFATLLAALTVGLLAGAALAGDGNGKGKSGNAPGQQKQDQAATATTAAATAQAQGNPNNSQSAKAASKQPASPSSHDAADGSKQYGNGKTALQIARQSVPSVNAGDLSEPGNSGHHKITICHNGHLITVDVHALKAHSQHLGGSDVIPATSASQCTRVQAAENSSTKIETSCPGTTVTRTSVVTAVEAKKHGKAGLHGKHEGLLKEEASTQTSFTPSGNNCGSSGGAAAAGGIAGAAAGAPVGAAGVAGGVLGVQVTQKHTGAVGGILGATATIRSVAAKGHLPFTGFPLWIAVLAGLALIAGGAVLTRRKRISRVNI